MPATRTDSKNLTSHSNSGPANTQDSDVIIINDCRGEPSTPGGIRRSFKNEPYHKHRRIAKEKIPANYPLDIIEIFSDDDNPDFHSRNLKTEIQSLETVRISV
jgi:hypothetical protein